MASREELALVFQDTMDYIDEEPLLQENVIKSKKNSKFYNFSDKINPPQIDKENCCTVDVTRRRTFAEVAELRKKFNKEKIAVLNFASALTPGGGVISGSRAQEESLCRCSTLYPVLLKKEFRDKYYGYNRSNYNFKYTDACIYTPDIAIIKSDIDVPERLSQDEWLYVDVITCAAPNLRRADYRLNGGEIFNLHINRGRRILDVALDNGVDVLVLGAFGCGAFGNPPEIVSKAYKQLVEEYQHDFTYISFAVFCSERDRKNYDMFAKTFLGQHDNLVDLNIIRHTENQSIVNHFLAIKRIIKQKCNRCDRITGCLGCCFSKGEMIYHIDECLSYMRMVNDDQFIDE